LFLQAAKQKNDTPEKKEEMYCNWLSKITDQIKKAHKESEGGTLVLMTSFKDVRGISE
jgi:hypothetical protein